MNASTCVCCGQQIPPGSPGGECPTCLLGLALRDGVKSDVAPSPAELQPEFTGVELIELIGHGGTGFVYKARQLDIDRFVAIKLLGSGRMLDTAFLERFQREAHALAQLSHPNIVMLHSMGRAAGSAYLMMEYVDGESLRERIHTGRLGPREALRIVSQICDALQYAHDRGIIHRDIKPENVLIDREGRVKIVDFGLAKRGSKEHEDLTCTGEQIGTARYMAPEQWKDTASVDHRADIFSLGVMFYELLTGNVPSVQYTPPSAKVGTDPRLDNVVARSIRERPEERYQRVDQLKTEVDRITSTHPWRRSRVIACTGILGLLLVAIMVAGISCPPAKSNLSTPRRVAPGPNPLPSASEILTSSDWQWTPPQNLGAEINSEFHEGTPFLSFDGLMLMFQSDRPGGQGDLDLWEARRASRDRPFDEPSCLGRTINSPARDGSPCMTADGCILVFQSNREGGLGGTDIWISKRASPMADWEPPEHLPATINSSSHEFRPWISADGLTLTFSSMREPRDGLWIARRPSRDVSFARAEPYGKNSHLRAVAGPSFSWDGKVILMNRFDRVHPSDLLWLGKIVEPETPLRYLKSFGPVVNSPHVDVDPIASADGLTVYFQSDRPGGMGEFDIWFTRRIPCDE